MIGWLIFGALVGWLASIIMKKNAQMGAIANIIVGIIGSFIGGWIGSTFLNMPSGVAKFTVGGTVLAVIGACLLLAIVNFVAGRSKK